MKEEKMRKFDRFNGVTEQELYERSLPDRVDYNLDIVFVNINPGLYSVYKGHHYSGPGNHFWRCLYESGLTSRVLKSTEDFKILDFKMGLVNMIEKPNIKSCQDLSPEEIRQAQMSLTKKIKLYRPKIVAFNGKSIYEIYMGSSVDKEFNFGKQPHTFGDTDTLMYAMPSSSARCSQLPKVVDKVPFYSALKKLKDHLNGQYPHELSDLDVQFPDFKVALEVPNASLTNSSLNKSDCISGDSGADDLDDENHQNSSNSHRIKFVRLNNIPYSQIPPDVLDTLKKQRQLKKNVTLTTTRDYFNLIPKKSVQSNRNYGATNASCSDLDTASTATNDSSDACSLNPNNEDTNNSNITSNGSSNGGGSRLSSVILNVCSANKAGQNNTSIINSPTPVVQMNTPAKPLLTVKSSSTPTPTVKELIRSQSPLVTSKPVQPAIQQQVKILNPQPIQIAPAQTGAGSQASIILVNNPNMNIQNQQTIYLIPQQAQVVTNAANNNNNNTNNNIVFITQNPQQVIQQQQPQQQQQQLHQHQPISLMPINPVVEDPVYYDEFADLDAFVANFELVKQESTNNYYTYDNNSLAPANTTNPAVIFSDDYSTALNYHINKSVNLFYDEDDIKLTDAHTASSTGAGRKRLFESINDATSYLINNNNTNTQCGKSQSTYNSHFSTNKRICKVSMDRL